MKAGVIELGSGSTPKTSASRGASILDFILRIVAVIGTLGSAIAMGTTNETLPFLTQFIRFRAKYDDLPMFTFFVVANSIVSVYLLLSLALSIFHIIRSKAQVSRIVLIFFDTGMLALLTAAASAAAAIVYLAHKGNTKANWDSFVHSLDLAFFCNSLSALMSAVGTGLFYMVSRIVAMGDIG
ncbi:unnamed protein product [Fraxinus pennsylvanica]|uniref:CASP-like protein n=1 Tax=Fraxinus pennsylvanica TaxID=56036 RepID=A0AAD1ZZW2_9LAMI|nr:unnamed protein product [Fraxinus pennsylvanica]